MSKNTLPAYIYRYTDIFTDEIVYVGIVYSGSSLKTRLNKERRDFEWLKDSVYRLEYQCLYDCSQTDLQALEAHLICLYHCMYNIQKTTWGESKFLTIDESKWQEYDYKNFNETQKLLDIISELKNNISLKDIIINNMKGELDIIRP